MFPGSIPSYAGFTGSHTLSADNHAAQSNAEQADISALATKVGTGASTPASGLVLRSSGAGVSAWGQVGLTTDISGVLPQANGGTGTTLATGTGKTVYDTSPTINTPTITTPVISDFTSATHTHTNNAGGGTLNAASALQAGSVNFNNLLSSIFSSQVTTFANGGTFGGTFSYVNLGGIKILWGLTAAQAVGTGGASGTVTLPGSFFSTLQYVAPSMNILATEVKQWCYIASQSTASITVGIQSTTNGSTQTVALLIIGT